MELELKLVREHMAKMGLPMRDTPPDTVPPEEVVNRRRLMRVEVDDMMTEGFQQGDVVALAIRIVRCDLANAGTVAQFGTVPEFNHFAEGVKDLLEHAQHRIDRALLAQDWHDVRVGCCQLETVLYGLVVNLGLPLPTLTRYQHQCYMQGTEVDRAVIAGFLRAAGIAVPAQEGEGSNDG